MKDALIFDRDVASGSLFEVDCLKKENKSWLALAAGITPAESEEIFPTNRSRAERATIPLIVLGGGQGSFLFVLRPLALPIAGFPAFSRAAQFAPGEGIPLVEIRDAYFRVSNLPGEDSGLNHLRWELDLGTAYQNPLEDWLLPWTRRLQYNPGHAPSHLHFNAPPLDAEAVGRDRREFVSAELRLAIGIPNPLALVLSIAAWLRQP
jgi:hypothetical protein